MTTEEKLKQIEAFKLMLANAKTYESALAHCNFICGMATAWMLDHSVAYNACQQIIREAGEALDDKLHTLKVL